MDISLWISVPFGALTAFVVAAHYYYKNAFKFWSRQGLHGPQPYPLLGNFGQLLLDPKAIANWMREYGKVFGAYEGVKPVLVVSDPELLRQLCIKDFNKFSNHHVQESNSELTNNFIFSTQDDHWRHIRAILSPTFTSGKMRRMFKLLDICADSMVEAMHERLKSKPIVNIKDLFSLYTMDAIASCCYGLRLLGYKGEASLTTAASRDEFVKLAMKLFEFSTWRLLLVFCLPTAVLRRLGIAAFSGKGEWAFAKKAEQIIKKRQESGYHFDDYLQTLIDAKLESKAAPQSDEDHLDTIEKHHAGTEDEQPDFDSDEMHKLQSTQNKLMSEIEVLSNATFLLIVGLETTSTLLTNCFYALSFHQTIQDKLYRNIKDLAKVDDKNKLIFDYDSLTSCQYLDAVISETLRMFPPITQTDRVASEDYYLKSHNLQVQKGTKVVLALKQIMNDPDNWHAPNVFDPERFMREQRHKIVQGSYCPFGIGPRHCLGMRFSLTETKVGIAKLLMEFKFEPAPGAEFPPEPKTTFGLGAMKRPEVMVTVR